jgi:hypothetical protein
MDLQKLFWKIEIHLNVNMETMKLTVKYFLGRRMEKSL